LPGLLFSIVIACHNHERFVGEAVRSALSQKHPSKEVIVVDDGSKDGTAAVLKTFGDSITLEVLPINRGAGAARNRGVSLARGQYVVFLDGDDVLMPHTLEVYDRLISARHPTLLLGRSAICYREVPSVNAVDPPGNIEFVEYQNFLTKDRSWVYNTSSLVVERTAFSSSGGWSEEIFYQDIQDLLNKLGTAGKTLLVLAPDTVWYRMHSTNAVRKVAPFVEGIHTLMKKAKTGLYPGGKEYRMQRLAWFGGLIFYWTKEAIRAGHYREGFTLLATKWWLILLAVLRRGKARLFGRRPAEIIPLVQH
jgi:glycosyltransferase involved in cell wall biosynthesis